jgi:hypothetical protein
MSHIILKLDVQKIVKDWLFKGQKGTYLDLVIYQNDDLDPYGNSHVVKQSPSKELRDQGTKPVIIGNGKWMHTTGQQAQATRQAPAQARAQAPAPKPAQAGYGRPVQAARPSRTVQHPAPTPDDGTDDIPF